SLPIWPIGAFRRDPLIFNVDQASHAADLHRRGGLRADELGHQLLLRAGFMVCSPLAVSLFGVVASCPPSGRSSALHSVRDGRAVALPPGTSIGTGIAHEIQGFRSRDGGDSSACRRHSRGNAELRTFVRSSILPCR